DLAQGGGGGASAMPPPAPGAASPMELESAVAAAPMKEPAGFGGRTRSMNKQKKAEGGEDKDADGEGQAGARQAVAMRSNVNPLAACARAVKTDSAGRAKVSVKVPDNLTRYRIVAIATAGEKQFGKGESAITARKPLMVRPSPPRFLNFGDTF